MDFDVPNKTKYLEKNTKLQELTSNLQENVKEMVTDYWDIFCEDGFRRTIRGFLFHIDTGNHIPIWWKPTIYFPNESEVMWKLTKVWMQMLWWNRETYHGENWWLYMQNHINKMCYGMSTSGGYVYPTKNLTRSLENFPYPYISAMMQYRILTHKKIIYCIGNGDWVLSNNAGGVQMWKTGIIHPGQKVAVEIDAYGGPKYRSNICSNDDEATNGMGHTR